MPLRQTTSGMKSLFEVMTSASADISNKRSIHLASSLSPSKSFSWIKSGVTGWSNWIAFGDMKASAVVLVCGPLSTGVMERARLICTCDTSSPH